MVNIMKGKILDFSINSNEGIISGDDGIRYKFTGKEWKSNNMPVNGVGVDFEIIDNNQAIEIYLIESSSQQRNQPDEPFGGFYKSSDDKMLAGVCAGVAHKWQISRPGLRFAWFFLAVFSGFPLLIYIFCWVIFPKKSTKNVIDTFKITN